MPRLSPSQSFASRALEHGYPRPLLRRDGWINLNGEWDFAIDADERWDLPSEVPWKATIVVPYSPETPASGIGNTGFYRRCWYRRTFEAPPMRDGERLLLHFGAVDWSATVWVNDTLVVRHEGGYTPFYADVTDALRPGVEQTVV
ncbi:MAG TPA: glycoside hydrolase family 2, partial [Thermoanaerobaculia bacterium]|nr:glycoside hydrolase family 2 [Thermoanaerobaculia bacterium]